MLIDAVCATARAVSMTRRRYPVGRPQRVPAEPSAAPVPTQVKVVPMKVGVAKETAPGERRVALVPEVLGKLKAAGLEILVERGAGAGSSIPDSAYQEAGATVVSTDDLYGDADAILRVAEAVRRRGREAAQGPGRARPAEPAHRPEDRQGRWPSAA